MVEWFKAAVLKTAEGRPSLGSNPSSSAIFILNKKFYSNIKKLLSGSSVKTVYLFKGLEILRLISRRVLLIIARLGRVHVPWLVPGIEQIDTFLFS